ncbi:MAG: sulfatase-like hydrolase/transferase [Saprospiraceae bacterium]|nr:sulfatase-like hydrolase/transferase [Saprospiraceae bacterium]
MKTVKFLILPLALMALGAAYLSPSPSSSNPNILLILTDDQGYHDVSYYGTKDIQTPHTDALAKAGMRFDNFYANCPVCSPTRAALLTGRYQEFVGVPGVIRTYPEDNWGYLDPKATMLPEMLKIGGYHTALIGKWHLGLESPNIPNERGFDFFHGWLGDMMDDYWKHRRHDINYMRKNTEVIDPEGHATDLFTQWSVDYITTQAKEDQPFFLYLAYNAPHFPVQPPADWLAKVKAREPGISEKRAKLVAFIEHLDDGIGQVIQALKESGQYENTIIVFTSDNGGLLRDAANNGPLRDGKQSVYEGGLKVPTVIVWKDKIVAGSSSDYKALSMDLFPTLVEAAGLQTTHAIEGQSFLPTLFGKTQSDKDRPLFFSRREGGTRYGGLTIQAVQLNNWKLLQNSPFAPQELYNLAQDPSEENNLIESESEKYKELNALLMKHLQEAGKVPWQKE